MNASPKQPPADATTRFSSRVDDYVRHRPHYPPAVYDFLRVELGVRPPAVVADVGSGTGIFAGPLLEAGYEVYCVEPNGAMRAAAERLLGRHPLFHSVDGTAEATMLPTACADVAVAAQAFHWFDVAKAAAEFSRVLGPGAPAVLVWNTRRTRGSPFLEAYEGLLNEYGTDYAAVRHDRSDPGRLAAFFGSAFRRVAFPNRQRLDLAGLRGRLLSSSYAPGPGHPRHAAMLAAAARLFDRFNDDGFVTIEYDTELSVGLPAKTAAATPSRLD